MGFLLRVCVIWALGASGAPLGIVWLSLGKLGEALWTQDGARTPPDGAKMTQDEAKMAQDEAKMIQDGAQTSPEERRRQNKKKTIHPNSRSSSFAGLILYCVHYRLYIQYIDIYILDIYYVYSTLFILFTGYAAIPPTRGLVLQTSHLKTTISPN